MDVTPEPDTLHADRAGLVIDALDVRFGGVHALRGVSLEAPLGQVTAVIGPNGAGKTTLVNAVTGACRITSGKVSLGGDRLAGRPSAWIARRGVARTFQNIALMPQLTVAENVELAFLPSNAGRLGRSRSRRSTRQLLGEHGLTEFSSQRPGVLPYGHQRRVEIARAMALRPKILLLDEPFAGLIHAEVDELIQTLQRTVDAGIGLLLIDHNMPAVMRFAQVVHVLDFGQLLASGTPDDISHNAAVVDAYLGTET